MAKLRPSYIRSKDGETFERRPLTHAEATAIDYAWTKGRDIGHSWTNAQFNAVWEKYLESCRRGPAVHINKFHEAFKRGVEFHGRTAESSALHLLS